MKWYNLHVPHIRNYNETIKYLESERSIESGNLIDDFYQQYLKRFFLTTGNEASFNPVQLHEFLLTKKPGDLYLWLGKLSRHLIISPKLNSILKEYNLFGCNAFEGVILKNKETQRSDYFYYHFYKSMWDNLNFNASIFKLVDRLDNSEIKEIRIDSHADYFKFHNAYDRKSGMRLEIKELVVKELNQYDLFYFFNLADNTPIISEKLYQRLREEKILGADIDEIVNIKIRGKD